MSNLAQLPRIAVDDYLEGELHSDVRHEYVAGQVFAMVGASLAHNLIATNLVAALKPPLRGGPCRVLAFDMKVRVEAADAFYYPDLAVTCHPEPANSHHITNPALIVEILSPSTESTDRREKLLNYRLLESLREYVLISQERCRIEVYRKLKHGDWEMEVYQGDESVKLASLGVELPMAEIYENVPGLAG